jgi:hypothetical protein
MRVAKLALIALTAVLLGAPGARAQEPVRRFNDLIA